VIIPTFYPPSAMSPAEIKGLNRKVRVLIRYGSKFSQVIFHPSNLSPSKQFIRVGGYFSDQLQGWLEIDSIYVAEVLEEMQDECQPAPPRRRWFHF
jgi:hypothetical protein